MDEVYNISQYFPLSISDPTLEKYIDHHLGSCIKCAENELYSSAYSHLHILYMIFVYIQLLRIAKEKSQEFQFCWIGFPSQEKDFLKNPSSPFSFSQIQEKTVFRFFRLVDFDDGLIANISALVNKRNDHLHANGKLFFETSDDFEKEVETYINNIQTIIKKQSDFLQNIYTTIIQGYETSFEMTKDEIETNFADPYYFSEYELKLLVDGKSDIVSKFIIDEI